MTIEASPPGTSAEQTERLSACQYLVFGLCFVTILIDGFDTQAIAYAGPQLMVLLHDDKAVLGLIFSAGLFGGLLGGFAFGSLGDRAGRRPLLLISLVVITCGSLATALAQTGPQIAVLRFLTGLGLGGAIPGVIALSAEYAPSRSRSTIVAIVFSGFPLGAVLGAFLSAAVLPVWGWRALFFIGAALPAITLLFAFWQLPESLQFLARVNRTKPLNALLVRLGDAGRALLQEDAQHPEHAKRGSVAQIFSNGLTTATLLIWAIVFLGLLSVYCIINWLPTLAANAGLPLQTAVIAIAALNIGGILGNIVLGRLIDKTSSYWPTGIAYLLGAVFVSLIGFSSTSSVRMLGMCFAAGLFCIGGQLSITAIIARIYPASMRSTGVGWSFGVGRMGGVAGPMLAGGLLSSGMSFSALMALMGLLSLIAGLAVIVLERNRARAMRASQTPA